MQAFRPLQRYFEFSGRSGRAEFWQFYLLTIAANWMATIVDGFRGGPYSPAWPVATLLVSIGTLIPSCTVAVRRLHDRGRSGFLFWLFLATSPVWAVVLAIGMDETERTGAVGIRLFGFFLLGAWLVLGVFFIKECASPGDYGHNGYGPPDVPPVDSVNPLETIRTLTQPRPVTPAAPTMNEALASIEQLGKLKEQGLITDEEFAAQKTRLLNPGA